MCDCVSTASTIARTAARPATYTSPTTPMTIEPVPPAASYETECTLHEDARILAGVKAIVSHAAERAALSDEAQRELCGAVLETCRRMFSLAGGSGEAQQPIRLTTANFPDRLQVTIETSGESPLTNAASASKAAGEIRGLPAAVVDRAECEIRDGRMRATLTRYAEAPKLTGAPEVEP